MSCFYFPSDGRYGESLNDLACTIEFTDNEHIFSFIKPRHTHIAKLTLPFFDARDYDGKLAFPTYVKMTQPFRYATNAAINARGLYRCTGSLEGCANKRAFNLFYRRPNA